MFKLRSSPYPPHLYPNSEDACRQLLLKAEPESCLPPVMEPAADLDSGCVQLSSFGNPVSYPLHLVLLLRVSFYIAYIGTHSFHKPQTHTLPHTYLDRGAEPPEVMMGMRLFCWFCSWFKVKITQNLDKYDVSNIIMSKKSRMM